MGASLAISVRFVDRLEIAAEQLQQGQQPLTIFAGHVGQRFLQQLLANRFQLIA